MTTERDMLVEYHEARKALAIAKENFTNAQTVSDEKESRLVELLLDKNATATAKYDGVGFAQLSKPKLYASCKEEHKPKLFDFVKEEGDASIIKEQIHPSSLSSFVNRLVEQGKAIPGFISYYMKQGLRFYAR